ncbi:MAG: ribonucleoside-diphosphate reductase alpha chain [Chloroflexi bacterium]|nr:MAG: ribonucleoside-diphosphate reductase alpha chain [Chloroflexota bacterium]
MAATGAGFDDTGIDEIQGDEMFGDEAQGEDVALIADADSAEVSEASSDADAPVAGGEAATLIRRRFTVAGQHPYDALAWERRTASITSDGGEVIFEQPDVEVPVTWSMNATNIVASKYFYGGVNTPVRESSVRQLIDRVVDTIGRWGREGGYFAGAESDAFEDELRYLLVNQRAAFNSPVWFNVGVEETPQCSACFINSVQDSMESIMDLATREALLFKWGSGTGTNLSTIRSSKEGLSGGGTPSGPVSFMRGYDAFANVIKSGGKTRRAAKMIILNADHPDVMEFVWCKASEEKKAWSLIDAGYDGSLNGDAYSSVAFQNANHSVRVSDDFMRAVEDDSSYWTRAVTSNEPIEELRARDVLRGIAEATHQCGDPGMQFDSTINDWNPCSATDRIHASNPCSEYMFLDDTACNLASINLLRFYDLEAHTFDVDAFKHASRILITAQEILVSNASYPSAKIRENSEQYRPLGLGYTNLGALLMARGLAYDSAEGRGMAGAITAVMTGEAYAQSARVARRVGPFDAYHANRDPFLRVIGKHRDAVAGIEALDSVPDELADAAQAVWDDALRLGRRYGYRNAQATVLAPTGTIAFMMDCDTTGVEPDIALVKYKNLSGGGYMKIVNQTVPAALTRLGYDSESNERIVAYIDEQGTIEGAPDLDEAHLTVFDCAFKAANGSRSIEPMGHVRMMGAAQPFLSGAISKTVNVPEEAGVDEIMQTYIEAWKLGVKAVAIYRDNSKRIQPLETTQRVDGAKVGALAVTEAPSSPADDPTIVDEAVTPPAYRRHRLPDDRHAVIHKFSVGEHEGYLTVGEYANGEPGEVFVHISKEGSTVSGLMDSVGALTSVALQSGVPLETLVRKFSHSRFEPSGWTRNPQIGHASSILDYVFRWMGMRYLENDRADVAAGQAPLPLQAGAVIDGTGVDGTKASVDGAAVPDFLTTLPMAAATRSNSAGAQAVGDFQNQLDAPLCHECGHIMVRNGSCYRCFNCGATSGCS